MDTIDAKLLEIDIDNIGILNPIYEYDLELFRQCKYLTKIYHPKDMFIDNKTDEYLRESMLEMGYAKGEAYSLQIILEEMGANARQLGKRHRPVEDQFSFRVDIYVRDDAYLVVVRDLGNEEDINKAVDPKSVIAEENGSGVQQIISHCTQYVRTKTDYGVLNSAICEIGKKKIKLQAPDLSSLKL